jgi:[protein-PII] uridylyltransferase
MLRRPPRPGDVLSRVTPRPGGGDAVRDFDVVTIDTPGLFARICGVVSLAGGQVVGAQVHTTSDGVAVDTVEVLAPDGVTTSWWARFEGDLVDAMAGRIALRARVDAMARDVGGPRDRTVQVEVGEGDTGDEVRVRTPDRLGLLFVMADALSDLHLDIRSAHVQTHAGTADDRFVVRSVDGSSLDGDQADEVSVALGWAVGRLGA